MLLNTLKIYAYYQKRAIKLWWATLYLLTSAAAHGHFASGLGAIELTVALHYVYKTPLSNLDLDALSVYLWQTLMAVVIALILFVKKTAYILFLAWWVNMTNSVLVIHPLPRWIMVVTWAKKTLCRKIVCVIGDGNYGRMVFEAANHAGILIQIC